MKSKNLLAWPIAFLFCIGLYGAGWYHGHHFDFDWPFKDGLHEESELGNHSVNLHEHVGHDHAHDDHDQAEPASRDFLELSETAKKNLGLTDDFLKPIVLQSFQQTISVPAIVVDRPGRTRLPISATMTGIVTHIHAVSGEAVEPGDLILEMRLTDEDLVTAQKDYLRSLGDRDIELNEIARIENAANSGAISNKALLDRQYSLDKLDSLLRSQHDSLRLHGLTALQIAKIETDRRLHAEMSVFAPDPDEHSHDETGAGKRQPEGYHPDEKKHTLVLQDIEVQKGQSVNAGEVLCTLADYDVLLIEGQAFESEAGLIAKAKMARWPLSATVGVVDEIKRIEGLALSWLNNEIDPGTRTFKFYVTLANELIDDHR
ncbi:MAG TPA: efflux RND transporter periplasmic adaptor subunit, partial [Pirellula sp.]|nr:efflux RND transporter periplasmic adaptor subunit [Pirellula sp.]